MLSKPKKTEKLTRLEEIAVTKSRLYHQYDEEEANVGNVSFSDVIFNISWIDDRIVEVSTMELRYLPTHISANLCKTLFSLIPTATTIPIKRTLTTVYL
jgi:hypothetical protein